MTGSREWVWTRTPPKPQPPTEAERQAIVAACDAFILDVLKPRFMPEIRPTKVNYPVDIKGAWAGGRYRFIQRYRTGWEENAGEEFDSAFARLDRTGPDRFDIYWMRHTGKWWRLHTDVSLAQALHLMETDGILHPA